LCDSKPSISELPVTTAVIVVAAQPSLERFFDGRTD
jgi:hypothetical protein